MSISENRVRAAGVRVAAALHPLALVLLLGLALRLALWGNLPRTGLISDEGEYLSAADWLAAGRGFAWYQGYLWTRAPLYPLLVAAHLALFGGIAALVTTQIALSLLNCALVYALARLMIPATSGAPLLAALLMAVYLPFALYPQLALSETLFITLLLGAFLALARVARIAATVPAVQANLSVSAVAGPLLLAGALLGLAALTRSLALGFIPIVGLWIFALAKADNPQSKIHNPKLKLVSALVFLLASAAVVLPWTLYSSRVYGGTVLVDTSGAFNLLLGARTAYDGRREDAQVRDFALGLLGQQPATDPAADSCAPYPGPLPSQAARQAAMTNEGLCLIAARPMAFAQKSLAELVDFFQINYTGAERFASGFSTGRLPRWYALGLFLLDDTLYVLALPLGVLGWAHARRQNTAGSASNDANFILHPSSFILLIGLWWLYNLAAAPLLFAINRFRMPLMPFVFIFAAYALTSGVGWLRRRRASALARTGAAAAETPVGHAFSSTAWYALAGVLAALLWLVAATPYAYLEPRAPNAAGIPAGYADSRWASYLGPYPSSLAITWIALQARPRAEGDQRFAAALRAGDTAAAGALLRDTPLSSEMARLGPALLAAHTGRPADVLQLLPAGQVEETGDARAAVLRGDALRTLGDEAGARAAFTPRFVDDANPVEWAWEWLRPAPVRRIDFGGNLDLGYISGCYLGEGDSIERATYRWCSDGAQLRFPASASGTAQQLVFRADGRGWAGYAPSAPAVQVLVNGRAVGEFTLDLSGPREFVVSLPPAAPGADILVTLRSATFVPGPERYLRQQSEQSLGQVQRLAVRLDWAELTER